ncbi:MAG TPA: ester cyclase [Thermoleophilaceae bacterium]
MATTAELRQRREAVVREHMESENRHDFDATIDTFDHPRYELIATGEVHDGEAEVRAYFADTRTAFPDQTNEPLELHHADGAVIVEFLLRGTHLGPLRGLPPTGRSFECRMTAFFLFPPDGDRIVGERVYFDQTTILRQLGVAHDPASLAGRLSTLVAHPVTIGRALAGRLRR